MPADEFDIIHTLFAPLATSEGARGLVDDVAILQASGRLVVTTDAIVEGVHFLGDDPIETVAKKALRANLSDLAGKGARPLAVLLTLIWPQHRPAAQIADFARGLGEDLRSYGVALIGGDTTATPGPLTVSITAFGEPFGARTPSRADAKVGEDLWLSGPIGDALLGLLALREGAYEQVELIARYRLPNPRLDCATIVTAHAGAAMDVSDGLIADARKMARASNVGLRIEIERVPVSAAARAWGRAALLDLFAGGDDYELLFTASEKARGQLEALGMHRIGEVTEGHDIVLIDADGSPVAFPRAGHVHRLGN